MENKKILFLSPYPIDKAPSQRLKYEQYFKHMELDGFEISTSPFVSAHFWEIIYKKGSTLKKIGYTILGYFRRIKDLFKLRKYDVVYIHLWVTPLGFPIFEWLVKLIAKKIIYDIDDMIFLGHSSEANKFLEGLKGKKKMISLMKSSDHIITCTPTLDKFVRQYNTNTTDISSTIDTEKYTKKEHIATEKITLGWSGSHSTSKYVKLLEPVFTELLTKGHRFKVLVIGDNNFTFSDKNIEVISKPWELSSEVVDLKQIDIGLYPLPNEQWVLGKSGLKALQYMSIGIPTIATNIGANSRIISNGENGFLVKNNSEWIASLELLINDVEKRNNIGEKAIDTVESKFSINATYRTYLTVLNGVL